MTTKDGAERAERRARVERLLARYPDLDNHGTQELLAWFRRHASRLEVATLSGDPALGEPYRQFRRDHVDRLSLLDWVWFLILFATGGLLFALIVWASH